MGSAGRLIKWTLWPGNRGAFNTLQTNMSSSAVIDIPEIPEAKAVFIEVLSGSIRYGVTAQVTLPVFGHIAYAGDIIYVEGTLQMSRFRMVPVGPSPSSIWGPASVHMTFLG